MLMSLCAIGHLCVVAPATARDSGLSRLDADVRAACACAEVKQNGVEAAIQCNDVTRAYARRSVDYRARWSADERATEARLRQLLEHCLSHAKSYRQSLDELGWARNGLGSGISPPATSPAWYRSGVAQLEDRRGQLVRLRTRDGVEIIGVLRGVGDAALKVARAKRDGGGVLDIRKTDVVEAQVLNMP